MSRGIKNALIVVDHEHLGPAMRACTDKQQKFVVALLETGGENETQAARLAGYGDGYETRGYELMRNPKILAAIREESDKRLQSGVLMATSQLYKIARNEQHKDQLKAIGMLLDRGGMQITTKHEMTVKDQRTDEELIARAAALANALGLDARKVLASVGHVIEGEFTDVTPNPPRTDDRVEFHDDLSDFLAPMEHASDSETLDAED